MEANKDPSTGGLVTAHRFDLDFLHQQLKDLNVVEEQAGQNMLQVERCLISAGSGEHDGNHEEGTTQAHLANVLEVLEMQRKMLSSLKPVFDNFRGTLRNAVNVCSPSATRPRNIMDLPDEILTEIFKHIKNHHPVEPHEPFIFPRGHVKDVRLTCRRFCNVSSHLLLDLVRVELNVQSLIRFEKISCHPLISKGVRIVRVLAHFYNSAMAERFGVFAKYHTSQIPLSIDRHAYELRHPSTEINRKAELTRQTAELSSILRSWKASLAHASVDTTTSDFLALSQGVDEDELWSKLLVDAYERYKQCYRNQVAVQEDGFFVESVAAGIARLPISMRLEVQDEEYFQRYSLNYLDHVDNPEGFIERLLKPMPWDESRKYHNGQPPLEMILALPSAVHKAGRSLEHLSIEISSPENYDCLALSKEARANITTAMQRLKCFKFQSHPSFYSSPRHRRTRRPTERAHLLHFLGAFLDTASLENIEIGVQRLWDSRPDFSLGEMISFRKWPILQSSLWYGLPIHLADINQFLHNHGSQRMRLALHGPYLVSGTWAECLDNLRQEPALSCRFHRFSGADCDGLKMEEKNRIFYAFEGSSWLSLAEQYVLGLIDYNPLRSSGPDVIQTESNLVQDDPDQ